jgi:hypothetical protein
MANILDRYGIKEVADVVFYKISPAGKPESPVLYLDTLKVSTIEQTAEEAEARGGKGNAALIAWDYGKEITVTLEDALFSAKSMAIMFGNGEVKDFDSVAEGSDYIMKTIQITPVADGKDPNAAEDGKVYWIGPDGKKREVINPLYFDENSNRIEVGELKANAKYFCTFDLKAKGAVIEVSANSFPGTYYVVGDTFARSETSGEDEMFQFIIPKAKVTSENTITLEAEGDPSVFNMNLKVLRPADGVMMRLVKYSLDEGNKVEDEALNLVHNHVIHDPNAPATTGEEAQG